MPAVVIEDRVTPSTVIPGGFKGLGESGTIPPPATIANAVARAVPEIAERLTASPLSPAVVWAALAAAKTDSDVPPEEPR
ncbi:hypothetical protein [Streptomyces sp. G-G2]|uniref:hypothetical protein n=1 Tax=Streptomyces sp. G-G2 TaxID=3046201 RepID=UPI0024BBA56C|nr:hypothetical protein [Streptomyces sp. G-G2]MDJ0384764.1 hypothetical protein [Streptomyces sp. G-G2]